MKYIANLIAGILAIPLVFGCRIAALVVTSERAFPGFSQCVSLLPGMTGAYLRRAFYSFVLPLCGKDCWISFGTVFSHGSASIGRSTYTGVGCMPGNVGKHCVIGAGSVVTKPISDYAIAYGNQARIVRYRAEAPEITNGPRVPIDIDSPGQNQTASALSRLEIGVARHSRAGGNPDHSTGFPPARE